MEQGVITHYWAKTTADGLPGLSVRAHCCNVGCVTDALFDLLSIKLVNKNLAVWLAACHDIGKISPGFESKCPAWLVQNGLVALAQTRLWQGTEPDHSKVSQFTLQRLLRENRCLQQSRRIVGCRGGHAPRHTALERWLADLASGNLHRRSLGT